MSISEAEVLPGGFRYIRTEPDKLFPLFAVLNKLLAVSSVKSNLIL